MLYINPQLEERLILRIDCPCDVYVSGGGVKNRTIMMLLQSKFGHLGNVVSSESIGVKPEAKEAVCFALLAYETIHQCPSNVPDATGASKSVILGKICLPSASGNDVGAMFRR
jgi:anhydro-N-acetylmuramic acid kinase